MEHARNVLRNEPGNRQHARGIEPHVAESAGRAQDMASMAEVARTPSHADAKRLAQPGRCLRPCRHYTHRRADRRGDRRSHKTTRVILVQRCRSSYVTERRFDRHGGWAKTTTAWRSGRPRQQPISQAQTRKPCLRNSQPSAPTQAPQTQQPATPSLEALPSAPHTNRARTVVLSGRRPDTRAWSLYEHDCRAGCCPGNATERARHCIAGSAD
ncbi:hypothetical protein CFBP7900_02170 [Xanthomonas hortorum pv. carotae]|uniref:Uncharacterized protein n=1 Tax=Xanthomonas hortorum pv. carotae TaxID=487904 RepID=A0A6V7BML0_9XANT|nr:hypothetical protein CFBP7900_02170 [Xanthomonas hortorum pv. carotae]CAD0303490.1 hypothetical protein CFBP7900_02170 [Xanthomonas hortorum pv. carotae]